MKVISDMEVFSDEEVVSDVEVIPIMETVSDMGVCPDKAEWFDWLLNSSVSQAKAPEAPCSSQWFPTCSSIC